MSPLTLASTFPLPSATLLPSSFTPSSSSPPSPAGPSLSSSSTTEHSKDRTPSHASFDITLLVLPPPGLAPNTEDFEVGEEDETLGARSLENFVRRLWAPGIGRCFRKRWVGAGVTLKEREAVSRSAFLWRKIS
ncbi:hypothetical protein BDQ17DRAFT_1333414 [Cyathus striatus]|nr:hypothetical protein BDQ17DRAFT_1333414 [Cyathus striatus]